MKIKLLGIIICMLIIGSGFTVSGGVLLKRTQISTFNNGNLSGYVNDTIMNPIEGALVRVYFHETYRENYSDSSGYYHVSDIPICYCMKNCTASKEGYKSDWVLLSITEDTKYNFVLTLDDTPALDPPYGPTEGFVNVSYTFYFVIPEGPQYEGVFIIWDWGDGSYSEWIGPYSSGEIASVTHMWSAPGDYDIRVRVKDNNGNVNISNPLIIRIYTGPKLRILPGNITGGIGKINAKIENIGDKDAFNISWVISIEGGILRTINITTSGYIDKIEANDFNKVFTDKFIIGFGGIGIRVTASAEGIKEASQQIIGYIILFYVITNPIIIL
jgi:hypothetical protein